MYTLRDGDTEDVLVDVQWADWSHDGRLLVATDDGRLQICTLERGAARVPTFEADLAAMSPDPAPPPAWAHDW
jgi:hypothetical protein